MCDHLAAGLLSLGNSWDTVGGNQRKVTVVSG